MDLDHATSALVHHGTRAVLTATRIFVCRKDRAAAKGLLLNLQESLSSMLFIVTGTIDAINRMDYEQSRGKAPSPVKVRYF